MPCRQGWLFGEAERREEEEGKEDFEQGGKGQGLQNDDSGGRMWVPPEEKPEGWEDDVKNMTLDEIYRSVFCAEDQRRPKNTWREKSTYPTCYFCGMKYRYSAFAQAVECHFDRDLKKETCGLERAVKACPIMGDSNRSGPLRPRFRQVHEEIVSRGYYRQEYSKKQRLTASQNKRQKMYDGEGTSEEPMVIAEDQGSTSKGSRTPIKEAFHMTKSREEVRPSETCGTQP